MNRFSEQGEFEVNSCLMRWIILLLTFTQLAYAGEIYRWVDEQGKVQFGDRPPGHVEKQSLKLRINTYSHPEIVQSKSTHRPKTLANKRVIMYGASWCGVCKQARTYFKQHGIRYTEYDVEKSEKGKAGFKKLKGRGVPVILVGKSRMNGFSAAHFNKLYER